MQQRCPTRGGSSLYLSMPPNCHCNPSLCFRSRGVSLCTTWPPVPEKMGIWTIFAIWMYKSRFEKLWYIIMLEPLKGGVNNIDYLITLSLHCLCGTCLRVRYIRQQVNSRFLKSMCYKQENWTRKRISVPLSVMAGWLGQKISKSAGLVGCSQHAQGLKFSVTTINWTCVHIVLHFLYMSFQKPFAESWSNSPHFPRN